LCTLASLQRTAWGQFMVLDAYNESRGHNWKSSTESDGYGSLRSYPHVRKRECVYEYLAFIVLMWQITFRKMALNFIVKRGFAFEVVIFLKPCRKSCKLCLKRLCNFVIVR
jgi:hypothetical protein